MKPVKKKIEGVGEKAANPVSVANKKRYVVYAEDHEDAAVQMIGWLCKYYKIKPELLAPLIGMLRKDNKDE